MTEYLIRLPWPDKRLSSNYRGHWSKVAKAKAEARQTAWAMAKQFGIGKADGAEVIFTYYPPDRRKRDAQNMPHMLKAQIDGLADALGCDDSAFLVHFPSGFADVVSGGAVLMHVKKL